MSLPFTAKRRPANAALTRRQMLQLGGAGLLNMSLPGLVAARVEGMGQGPASGAAEKSCIYILLCGGPSHLDTWDLKPNAPAEIRGPYQPVATAVPGMRISELHTRLAKLTKHICLIRTMTHTGPISNHFDAMHNCLSGVANGGADVPYIGSVLAKLRPSQRAIANYVWLIKCVGDPVFCAPNIGTGGFLGAPYAPLFVGTADNNPSMPNFRPPEELFPRADLPTERLLSRRQLLDGLSRPADAADGPAAKGEWQDIQHRAFDLATSSAARRAFEVEYEDPKVRDRYGRHPLGQNLLLARRLVESGVGFVTVNGWTGPAPSEKLGGPPSSSWDMHGSNMGMGNAFGTGSYGMGHCLPRLDEALSALLTDLDERGMLENTLVVVTGEFGRTPNIISGTNPGRQHWPACFSTMLAGGGIRGGQVYGESDKTGSAVKDKPVRPQDLTATIYHALGVPPDPRMTKDGVMQPLTTGTALVDLFG